MVKLELMANFWSYIEMIGYIEHDAKNGYRINGEAINISLRFILVFRM